MPLINKKDPEQVRRYQEFVRSSPYACATQDMEWAVVKQGWDDAQITLERGGVIAAAISLLIKPVLCRWCMLYAPRGPVCDINDTALVMELMREVDAFAKKRHAFLLRFDPEALYSDELCRSYTELGFIVRGPGCSKDDLFQPRYNMILNIGGKTEDELMAEFSQKTRYNIRYAGKHGVTVRYSREPADLDSFYSIFQVTCIRDRIGGRPKDYFERILQAFGEDCRIYIAEYGGEVIAGAIAISYGGEVWYSYGASSNEHRNLMSNYAMQMEMIRWGLEQNKLLYDFGGVFELSAGNGLYRFKEGFCRKDGVSEFVGEFDLVYGRVLYFAFNRALPAWRRLHTGKRTKTPEGAGV